MKKKLLIIQLLLITLFYNSKAQSDCEAGTSLSSISTDNTTAFLPIDNLWIDNGDSGYLIKNSNGLEASSMLAGGIWMGAFDANQNLKLSATTYGSSTGNPDYWPGPIDPITGQTIVDNCINWDRHFITHAEDIDALRADFEDGSINDPIPNSLLAWPAKGNPHFKMIHGFKLPTNAQELAPFWDQNADGIYNPEDGDYPVLMNTTSENEPHYADEMIFWIYNDVGNYSTISWAAPLHFEVHMMAYSYENSMVQVSNTTFYDMKVINRAYEERDEAYISLWMDPDLGCYDDDYVGCLPEENVMFVYNADAKDGDEECTCVGARPTFCESIPLMGVKFLRTPTEGYNFDMNGELVLTPPNEIPDSLVELQLSSFIVQNRDTLINPFPGIGSPYNAIQHYSLMNGQFIDGSSPLYNGEEVKYMYPGNPALDEEWSMCSAASPAGDQATLMNFGPLRFGQGEAHQMTFCVTHVENVDYPCPNTDVLLEAFNEIESFYTENITSNNIEQVAEQIHLTAAPNPMTDYTIISLDKNANEKIKSVNLLSNAGQLIRQIQSTNEHEIRITRDDLQEGIYFYQILTNTDQIYSGKLLIH